MFRLGAVLKAKKSCMSKANAVRGGTSREEGQSHRSAAEGSGSSGGEGQGQHWDLWRNKHGGGFCSGRQGQERSFGSTLGNKK